MGSPFLTLRKLPYPHLLWPVKQLGRPKPFPAKPKPFARQSNTLTEVDVSPFAENLDSLKQIISQANKQLYAPPSLEPNLLLPGYDGAAEWGGTAADPEDGIIYVNSNEMA